MNEKKKWLDRFKKKYEKIAKDIGKKLISGDDYQKVKGSPVLSTIKQKCGLTFYEAEKEIGIVRPKSDLRDKNLNYLELGRQKRMAGKIPCERGAGQMIYKGDCMYNETLKACQTCKNPQLQNVHALPDVTPEEETATKYDPQSVMSGVVW